MLINFLFVLHLDRFKYYSCFCNTLQFPYQVAHLIYKRHHFYIPLVLTLQESDLKLLASLRCSSFCYSYKSPLNIKQNIFNFFIFLYRGIIKQNLEENNIYSYYLYKILYFFLTSTNYYTNYSHNYR